MKAEQREEIIDTLNKLDLEDMHIISTKYPFVAKATYHGFHGVEIELFLTISEQQLLVAGYSESRRATKSFNLDREKNFKLAELLLLAYCFVVHTLEQAYLNERFEAGRAQNTVCASFNVKEHFPGAKTIFFVDPITGKKGCSKELIHRMIAFGQMKGYSIRALLVAEEDMDEIRAFVDDEVNNEVRAQLLGQGVGRVWGLKIQTDKGLNGKGVVVGLPDQDMVFIIGETGRWK